MGLHPSIIGLVFLGIGVLFSAMHVCLLEMSRLGVEELLEKRSPGTRQRVGLILKDVPGHARAAALTRILCNLAVAVAAVWCVAQIRGFENPTLLDGILGVVAGGIVLWLLSATVSESIARHAAERFVIAFSPLVRATYLVQKPLAPLANGIDAIVRRLSGAGHVSKKEEMADELLDAVEEGEREGAIDEGERRMIEAVVDFKNATVEQIMTPRTEVEALELTNNLGSITAFVRKARHSRIPVYKPGGTLDDVIGFFYVKDLLRWLAGDSSAGPGAQAPQSAGGRTQFDLKTLLRPAYFVPRSKTVRDLLDELIEKKQHVAVVADEYGGLAGIVSLEDIVEEVFGEIQDEYEKAEDEPPKIDIRVDDQLADIDARAYIHDVNEALEPLGVSVPEDDEYDTLGGFVMAHLGRIPEVNESFVHGRALISVLEAAPTRVLKVRVQVREFGGDDARAADPPRAEAAADRGK